MIDIPGYSIKREVGTGGMASVYLAMQTSLEREVALKVMSASLAADPAFTRRFLQEARMLASLAHPNIVQVFDVGVTNAQQHYFAMQFLPGGDFVARQHRGLSEAELKRVLLGIAAALGYAHQRGYVHRDVAPGNILFDSNDTPVLTDFGIALAAGEGSRITSTGFSVGTSHYMSPEQARGGDVDARSDLYSLGVLTWFGLTGAPPYDGADGFAVAYAHVFEAIPRLPADKSHWQGLIDKALAKDPKDRFLDVAQFTAALEAINVRGGSAPPAAARPSTPAAPARTDTPANPPAAIPGFVPGRAPAAVPAGTKTTPRSTPAIEKPKPAPATASDPAAAPAAPAPAARVEVLKASSAPVSAGGVPRWLWAAVGGIALVALVGVGVLLWSSSKPSPRPVTASAPTTPPPAAKIPSPPPVAPVASPTIPADASIVAPANTDVSATATSSVAGSGAMATTPADAAVPADSSTPPNPPADSSVGLPVGATDDQSVAAEAELPTVVDPVVELVKLGRADLAAQRYSSPPGMNALERFRLALRIDKRDKFAKQGVVDTARAYLTLADKARAANDTTTMGQHFAKALEIAALLPEGKVVADEVSQRRGALAAPFLEQAAKAAAAWDKTSAKAAYDQALTFDPDNAAAKEGIKKLAAIGAPGYVFRDKLADGSAGPEMIVAAGVAVGRREVTVGEFRRYWSAGGARGAKEPSCRDRESIFRSSKKRSWQNPDISQDDSHPVVCVSWDEAAGFARWLAEQTGQRYRLVGNAEWDQLVRAAGSGGCSAANLADADFAKAYDSKGAACSDGYAGTAPAGHYAAAGGVYDIDGNVREWVNACGNGSAASGGCRDHRYRGRAWLSPDKEPASFADSASSDVAGNTIGFRVAREIEQK